MPVEFGPTRDRDPLTDADRAPQLRLARLRPWIAEVLAAVRRRRRGRDRRSLADLARRAREPGLVWVGAGVIALGLYGFVATLQPDANFGRILAAYGGVFVAGSLPWGMVMDGFRPDRYDVAGALICLVGVAVIMYYPPATPDARTYRIRIGADRAA